MKILQSTLMYVAAAAMLLATASCDRAIYDNELDCSAKVQFVFTKHRQALQAVSGQATDVFDSTIGSVHLFVYDAVSGALVYDRYATTNQLRSATELQLGTERARCFMPVDLAPGRYRFVAWCGLDANDQNNAFYLNAGDARSGYAACSVKRSAGGDPVHEAKYEPQYHGAMTATISADGAVVPIELTKNTNDIAVWVQHTTMTFDKGAYEVVYTDANGTLKFEDNTLSDSAPLTYRAHTTSLLNTSTEYNGELVEAGALIAHLSTSRLLAANRSDARLEVRDREGKTVFSIPFIQYLLEMQTFTADSQYYLDCEDTYNCSFYLTGDGSLWAPARIIINNWVRVPDQVGGIGGES